MRKSNNKHRNRQRMNAAKFRKQARQRKTREKSGLFVENLSVDQAAVHDADDELFWAIDLALNEPDVNIVMVATKDRESGCSLKGRNDKSKNHVFLCCARDEQVRKVMTKYEDRNLSRIAAMERIAGPPVNLDAWMEEILGLVRHSFEVGEVSKFGGFFMEDIKGQRMIGIMQKEDATPDSWAAWVGQQSPTLTGEMQMVARYTHVGTAYTPKGTRFMYAVAADRLGKMVTLADIENNKLEEWVPAPSDTEVRQFCASLPEIAREMVEKFDGALNNLPNTWKSEEMSW
jgi:hypothetical protein